MQKMLEAIEAVLQSECESQGEGISRAGSQSQKPGRMGAGKDV